jgi:hypothetical protein
MKAHLSFPSDRGSPPGFVLSPSWPPRLRHAPRRSARRSPWCCDTIGNCRDLLGGGLRAWGCGKDQQAWSLRRSDDATPPTEHFAPSRPVLNLPKQHEYQNDDQHDTKSARRIRAPGAAVWPSRKRSDQKHNKNDENDCSKRHWDHLPVKLDRSRNCR